MLKMLKKTPFGTPEEPLFYNKRAELFQQSKKIEKMDFPILRSGRHNEKIYDQHRPEKGDIFVVALKYNI